MDLMTINVKIGYLKLIWFKYKLLEWWSSASIFTKYSLIFLTSGGLVFAYNFFKSTDYNSNEDSAESKVICARRKKGLPPGLYNEGNTCFVNVVLQAISSSSSARKWIQNIIINQEKNANNELTVVPNVDKIIKVLSNKQGNGDDYSAMEVILSLQAHGWVISNNEQHDAYEFFQLLIATLNEETDKIFANDKDLLKIRKEDCFPKTNSSIINRVSRTLPSLDNEQRPNDPFQGSFANRMICKFCGCHSAVKFQKFESLILNIEHATLKHGCTLESCFDRLIELERIENVFCQRCSKQQCSLQNKTTNVKRLFLRQTTISKLPQCFCMELQRTYYANDGSTKKNQAFVRFPEFFDATPYRYYSKVKSQSSASRRPLLHGGSKLQRQNLGSSKSPGFTNGSTNWYKLISVLLHFGDAYNGHFTVFRRSPDDSEKWVCVSDQDVKFVSKETVMNSFAYMLFYEKL